MDADASRIERLERELAAARAANAELEAELSRKRTRQEEYERMEAYLDHFLACHTHDEAAATDRCCKRLRTKLWKFCDHALSFGPLLMLAFACETEDFVSVERAAEELCECDKESYLHHAFATAPNMTSCERIIAYIADKAECLRYMVDEEVTIDEDEELRRPEGPVSREKIRLLCDRGDIDADQVLKDMAMDGKVQATRTLLDACEFSPADIKPILAEAMNCPDVPDEIVDMLGRAAFHPSPAGAQSQ